MATDRYERRHRRTARHPEVKAIMAGANFDAVPSLAEAMGLEAQVRYWQVERLVVNNWLGTDFRISGTDEAEADRHLKNISIQCGWTARRGREVDAQAHYCDFAWVNAS